MEQFTKKWFDETTPTNAIKATGTLTISGVVADGQTVTIGSEVYEFDTDTNITEGNILVDVSGGVTAAAAVTALVDAITTNSTIVDAEDGAGDTVVITSKVVGTESNDYATTETMTNGAFEAVKLSGGLYCTPVSQEGFIVISGVYYIATKGADKYTTDCWYSATPSLIS